MAHENDIHTCGGEDALATLLRRADVAAGPPPHADDLAGRVLRRRDARRRRARGAATTIMCVALAAGVWWIVESGQSSPAPGVDEFVEIGPVDPRADVVIRLVPDALEVTRLRLQLDNLARECAGRDEAIRLAMAAGERRRTGESTQRRRSDAIRSIDPLMELQWQREQAALVLVRQGDRLADELKLPEPAAVAYRQASDTFAGTRWGAVARARLAGANDALP